MSNRTATDLERYFAELVNAERAKRGLDPLRLEKNLNQSAEVHSEWILKTDTFSHTGAGGSSHDERIEAAGFDMSGDWHTGENLSLRSIDDDGTLRDEVRAMMEGLMASPGHKANILKQDYTHIGIGLELGEYKGYTVLVGTQNFGATTGKVDLDGGGAPPAPGKILAGGLGADRLSGTNRGDKISGRAGNDTLFGQGGNDTLFGQTGRDELRGGNGHDALHGEDGNDRLIGGLGDDRLIGGKGHDRMAGHAGDDRMIGGPGNDHGFAATAMTGWKAAAAMTGSAARAATIWSWAAPARTWSAAARATTICTAAAATTPSWAVPATISCAAMTATTGWPAMPAPTG